MIPKNLVGKVCSHRHTFILVDYFKLFKESQQVIVLR